MSDIDEEVIRAKPSQVITRTNQSTEYHLYLHGRIGHNDEYMEHFAVFHIAGPNDVVYLYISSEGGSLATSIEYIRHIRECQAPVIAIIGLECASAASAIALACSGWEIDEFSTMLVHGFSYGNRGAAYAVFNQAEFNMKLNAKWVKKTYEGFLSEEEMQNAIKGHDILFDSEELIERLEAYSNYRKALAEELAQLELQNESQSE